MMPSLRALSCSVVRACDVSTPAQQRSGDSGIVSCRDGDRHPYMLLCLRFPSRFTLRNTRTSIASWILADNRGRMSSVSPSVRVADQRCSDVALGGGNIWSAAPTKGGRIVSAHAFVLHQDDFDARRSVVPGSRDAPRPAQLGMAVIARASPSAGSSWSSIQSQRDGRAAA